ncbi:GSCFA domain-containing protein [Robiginitalea sediminis]|uniref:GSCFA domain-containing protein n=1 Tax=Robiginitalea sediminis TaxID=1982593 RepID=UPI000B4A5EBF|nr:GSCFA domain-containing protein [Robiginitalea sediminis]
MKWSTEIPISKVPAPIDYHSGVLLMGSCFAAHMGEHLRYFQFRQWTNPFGVIFHPQPLAGLVTRALEHRPFTGDDLFEHQGLWRCYAAHGSLAHPDAGNALERLNGSLQTLATALRSATHVVVTLGTAWGYRHRESGILVANCHKQPSGYFSKELAGVSAIAGILDTLLGTLKEANPQVTPILTVSPVRHLRDGIVENQRSKAHLVTAIHQVLEAHGAHYFPAYELLVDELRDYRFYAEDLAHPSAVAVQHIWDRFREAWVSPAAQPVMDRVEALRKGLAHRPLNPQSEGHRAFLQKLEGQRETLQAEFPHMDFSS